MMKACIGCECVENLWIYNEEQHGLTTSDNDKATEENGDGENPN